jgi:hypothetical protein
MKLFKLIPVYAAAAALIVMPAASAAQAQGATDTSKEATKKPGKKAKKTAPPPGEATAQDRSGRAPATGSAQRAMSSVSDAEIASAKASGKVWVNTETGVYHKGGRWYGATKQGKFMTEDDAVRAGYRASKSK